MSDVFQEEREELAFLTGMAGPYCDPRQLMEPGSDNPNLNIQDATIDLRWRQNTPFWGNINPASDTVTGP